MSLISRAARKIGVNLTKRRMVSDDTRMASLKPVRSESSKGHVLLSYIVDPFLLKDDTSIPKTHTHYWESFQMGKAFLHLGYELDVISYLNTSFKPERPYSIFVGARTNFERIARNLPKACIKLVHLDTAHWMFNNHAALGRSLDLQKRRQVTVKNYRMVEENWAIEHADYATILGNEFTIDTYAYAQKPIFRIPISTQTLYPWPDTKDFAASRNRFVWFGSQGFVHKGLDLVLEAFSQMPECELTVCGPINDEKQFERAYYAELYETKNIHTAGWVDVEGEEFRRIIDSSIGVIYPSCAEGGGGSVVLCMHGGLIPVVSYEASVDVSEDFGVVLKSCSVDSIKESVRFVSQLPPDRLKSMARGAWEFARNHHTRERFRSEYGKTVEKILGLSPDGG